MSHKHHSNAGDWASSCNTIQTIIVLVMYSKAYSTVLSWSMMDLMDLMGSPVGLVPKKDSDEIRIIMHLSFPYGTSINNFIDPDKAATQY